MLKLHNHKLMINMACILKATQAKVGRYITHAMPSFLKITHAMINMKF